MIQTIKPPGPLIPPIIVATNEGTFYLKVMDPKESYRRAFNFVGDGIRTFPNTGEEDDEDLDSIRMGQDMYRVFAAGFLGSTREAITSRELV